MFTVLKARPNGRIFSCLMSIFLLTNFLALTGCATMGAKLATHIAEKEERKDCSDTYDQTLAQVDQETCERITRLIKKVTKEVGGGFVAYDKFGRLKLKGTYENEEELALAHMIVLTIVGTSGSGISPVTPKNLKEIKTVKSYAPQAKSKDKGEKYALLIGVSQFKSPYDKNTNPSGIKPIKTAVKDVVSIRNSLKKQGFTDIVELTDSQATKEAILDAMGNLVSKASSPNDTVVFYISTHGTPPDTYGKMGIIPYDFYSKINYKELIASEGKIQNEAAKVSKDEDGDQAIIKIAKERIASLKTAVSFDNLQDFITNIKAEKFVAIIDTCYSGSALPVFSPLGDKQYVEREKNALQSLGIEQKGELLGGSKLQSCGLSEYTGIEPQEITSSRNTLKNAGEKGMFNEGGYTGAAVSSTTIFSSKNSNDTDTNFDEFESDKVALPEIKHILNRGKVLISATNGEQQSLFDNDIKKREPLQNSFFTYYLAKGLDKFKGQIFNAFDYARVRTARLVARDYPEKRQTPEMMGVPMQCININLSK